MSKFFRMYIHSSVGKEVQFADKNLKPPVRYDFKQGDVIAYLDTDGKYKWGIVKKDVKETFDYDNKTGTVKIDHDLEIIKNNSNDYNENQDDKINKYYCKIPIDYDKTPLSTIFSKDGNTRIVDEYNVDLM